MRFRGAALALALILAGCAEDLPTARWSNPGASYDEFLAARSACEREAREEQHPFYLGGARFAGRPDAVDSGLFVPCMAAAGWHEDPKGFAAPADDAFPLSP